MSLTKDKQLTDIVVADMMISSEKVAHVQVNNPLEHALLVLIKSGYSAVPVLDASYKLVGIIGKTAILNQTFGLERIETEKLSDMRVKEIMNTDIPVLLKTDSFKESLNVVINYPFVCVADESGYLDGILIRRVLLNNLMIDIYSSKLN